MNDVSDYKLIWASIRRKTVCPEKLAESITLYPVLDRLRYLVVFGNVRMPGYDAAQVYVTSSENMETVNGPLSVSISSPSPVLLCHAIPPSYRREASRPLGVL